MKNNTICLAREKELWPKEIKLPLLFLEHLTCGFRYGPHPEFIRPIFKTDF